MAITFTTTLMWNGSNGRWSLDDHTYTAFYRTVVGATAGEDVSRIQAASVVNHFVTSVKALGTVYQYANDPTDLAAVLQSVEGERDLSSHEVWILRLQYGPEQDQQEDEDGNPTNDPLQVRPKLDWSTVNYQVPVETATYRSGFGTQSQAEIGGVGAVVAPQSSAHEVYNPPLLKDDARGTIILTRNYATINGDLLMGNINDINSDTLNFDYRGFTKTCDPFTLKLRDAQITEQKMNNVDYWQAKLTYDWNKKGWRFILVDRGLYAVLRAGFPDGDGEILSASDPRASCLTAWGLPRMRRLVDPGTKELISEPQLLDGNGIPLDIVCGSAAPVEVTWSAYDEVAMAGQEFLAPYLA